MKIKHCFALAVILIILFSLTTVAASENITGCTPVSGDMLAVDVNGQDPAGSIAARENIEKSNISNDGISSGDDGEDGVDLSVWIDVEYVYRGDEYNRAGFEVPWTITVAANGATAKNVKVHEILSDNMEYVTSNATMGVFSPETGIWNVGDLAGSTNASLTIITKLLADGRYKNSVNATTDSNDTDLSNNFLILSIKSGTSHRVFDEPDEPQITHSPPEEPDDFPEHHITNPDERKRQKHNIHPLSFNRQFAKRENYEYLDSNSKEKSRSENENSNPNNESSDSNITNEVIKAIPAYDHTRIPLLIFAAFIVLLVGIVAYDRVKS